MASRRSELSALWASDLTDDRGLVVKRRRSKTDQEGKGRLVRAHSERGMVDAVAAARMAGISWNKIAEIPGASAEQRSSATELLSNRLDLTAPGSPDARGFVSYRRAVPRPLPSKSK